MCEYGQYANETGSIITRITHIALITLTARQLFRLFQPLRTFRHSKLILTARISAKYLIFSNGQAFDNRLLTA